MTPIVSVICTCHNHAPFLEEAIDSVFAQDYAAVELIVVDDGSTDGSIEKLYAIRDEKYKVTFTILHNESPIGICKAFNKAFKVSKGEFIIDLAGDDVLMPGRITAQVQMFKTLGEQYGVLYTDGYLMDEKSKITGKFSDTIPNKNFPSGNIYSDVVERYFIFPPSVMFRRKIFEKIGGYDESLAYEDFDLWVRASRITSFAYSPELLVKKRTLNNSLSAQFSKRKNLIQQSTYRICQKIAWLNQSEKESKSLRKRIRYESKYALLSENFELVNAYQRLAKSMGSNLGITGKLAHLKLPYHLLYTLYKKIS